MKVSGVADPVGPSGSVKSDLAGVIFIGIVSKSLG